MSCRSWPGHRSAWGVGFLTWAITARAVEHALSYRPRAVMLSFGDPAPYTELIRGAGVALIIQVTDLDEARQALDAGADVIVAQGTEAGGHGGETRPVHDVVRPGGRRPGRAHLGPGRGRDRRRTRDRGGAVPGRRRGTDRDPLLRHAGDAGRPAVTKAIVDGHGEDTARNRVHDILRTRPGRPGIPAGRSAIRSLTSGRAGKRNWPPIPPPGRPTGTRSPAAR